MFFSWATDVAQLIVQLPSTPEIRGLNRVIVKLYWNCIEKTKRKKKMSDLGQLFHNYFAHNFKLQVVVGGGAVDPDEDSVLERRDEAESEGVHLGVWPLLDVVVIANQARFRAPLVGHRL